MKFKTNSEYDKSKNLDLDAKDSAGYAALHKAVFSRRFDEVKLLIDKGARVDVEDKHKLTPLFYAVMNNDEKMIKFLVEIGNANVNLGKYNNPLGIAISRGYMELAEYLIDKGADINRQDSIGRTFLHKAAEDGNLAAVKFLVEKGARLDVLDEWNHTPLHVAANIKVNKGHIEVVDYLVKNGADINLTHNYTPIHLAITRGNLDMVKCLIDNGADLYIKRACDGTPLTYAKQQGQVEIVNYMDSVMSNLSLNKTVSLDNTNINIKYDLATNKLDTIEKSIKDAVRDFKGAFNTSDHDIRINAYVFNTQNEFKEYLKKVGFDAGEGVNGYTRMIDLNKGNAADVYVYLDSKGNLNQHTLEHEIGHAMHFANLGLSYILPKAMHEAIANYVAGLQNGKHINDHGDKEALIAIKNKNLKLDEILRNDYQGNHYYSEAEQVVKFLEHKHPDLIDNLLKSLSTYKRYHDRDEGKKLVEDFLTELKGYTQEFKQWVKAELSGEQHMEYNVVESNSVESSTSQQSAGKGLYGYSPVHNVSGDKTKIESVSREDSMQPAKKASEDEQGKAVTTKVMKYNKQPFLKVNIDDNNVENTIGKVNEINKVTGATSLHFAASLGDLSKVAMLLKHNSYTDTRDHNRQTPLHYAIQSGNTEVAKYLIDHGANLNVHDNYYQKTNTKYVYYKTPLHYAIESGNIEIAKYLIDRGANPNIQDAYSKTPLYSAIYSGNTEIVKYLLDHNADPNSKSYYTFPLLAGIKLGNAEIVKSLIEYGADLGIKNTSAQTLLHYAIELKHTEIAKYLIDRGIDVDTRDISSGKSPLHFAMHMKNMEVVKYLIEHNADIDIQDSYGLTPLHLAVDIGNKKMIEQLVEKGANINAQDNDGWTPLVHAVRHGKLDTIEYLIKNKANVDVVGKDGRTLVEHAELWAEEKGLARDVIDSKGDNDSYYRELSKEAATWEKAGKDMLSYLKKITMQENDIDQMPADQPASEERNKRSLVEDEEKQEEITVIDNVKQHPLKIKVGEAIGDGKYKAVLQAQNQDIDNFYQNLSSQYTAGKYNYNQMIALYNKVYVQDSNLDGKPITLSEAYVTNDHLFIKNQDFGILNDFNEMFYKSDEFM